MRLSDLNLRVDRDAELPLGAQLAAALREAIGSGALAGGDRLPSVRDLAGEAGVNVNTARAVYGKLEHEGLVRSEQGRGTFVAEGARPDPAEHRRRLKRQIAGLEAELGRFPDQLKGATAAAPKPAAPSVLSSDELEGVRDALLARLEQLDDARADVVRRLELLDAERGPIELEPAPETGRHTSSSVGAARVRWVGGL